MGLIAHRFKFLGSLLMIGYIVVNDSLDENEPGDVRIYESLSIALSSFEIDDIHDTSLHVYDENGIRLIIDKNDEPVREITLRSSGSRFQGLKSVLIKHSQMISIPAQPPEAELHAIVRDIFRINPNPYT